MAIVVAQLGHSTDSFGPGEICSAAQNATIFAHQGIAHGDGFFRRCRRDKCVLREDSDGAGSEETRERGLARMREVYGWEVSDGPGDFFGYTVDHLFAEIWNRPGLSMRDRRLLLIGTLVGGGLNDVLDIQLPAALGNGELTPDDLREIVIFLTHYAGWPQGAKLNMQVEGIIAKFERSK
jgi:4-carboxymuconolactone decarboxylase